MAAAKEILESDCGQCYYGYYWVFVDNKEG